MALVGEMKYLQIGNDTYSIPEPDLPIASSSTLGGIKVGTNLSIDSSTGVLSVTGIPTAATANPLMDGTAAIGSSSKYAKEDHVHPTDTSRAAATTVVTQASINSSGLITYKNSSGTSLFTLQLPLYDGGVS